jgi:hypothetical protein
MVHRTSACHQHCESCLKRIHPEQIPNNEKWVRAHEVFTESVPFSGTVWNITVDSSDPTFESIQQDKSDTEHSYVLENGVVAHNAQLQGK